MNNNEIKTLKICERLFDDESLVEGVVSTENFTKHNMIIDSGRKLVYNLFKTTYNNRVYAYFGDGSAGETLPGLDAATIQNELIGYREVGTSWRTDDSTRTIQISFTISSDDVASSDVKVIQSLGIYIANSGATISDVDDLTSGNGTFFSRLYIEPVLLTSGTSIRVEYMLQF